MNIKVVGKIDLEKIYRKDKKPAGVRATPDSLTELKRVEAEQQKIKNKLLLKLYQQQQGLCYYCKKKCFKDPGSSGVLKDNAATIEHLYPKTDIRRLLLEYEEHTVMACYSCNQSENNKVWTGMMVDYKDRHPILTKYISWRYKLIYKIRRVINKIIKLW